MSKNLFRNAVTILAVLSFLMCLLPIVSVYSGGTESGTFIIRGFNLTEFSALGVIPMIAPLLIPIILLGHQSKAAKEIELMALLVGNTVAYVHGFNATRAWIDEIGGRIATYHPGIIILPIVLMFVLMLSWVIGALVDGNYVEEHDDELPC